MARSALSVARVARGFIQMRMSCALLACTERWKEDTASDRPRGFLRANLMSLSRVAILLPTRGSSPSSRERFIAAIQGMDVVNADQELARAAMLFPPGELVSRILSPIFDEISRRKALKELGMAQERVATGLVRRMLESLIRLYPPSGVSDTVVLATPIGEKDDLKGDLKDDFNLVFAAFLAAAHGWRVVYLGVEVPAPRLRLRFDWPAPDF